MPFRADDAELGIAGGGLHGMLLAVACARAGLSTIVVAPQDPAAMAASETGAETVLGDGARLRARLVVAADGKNSPLRQAAGIRTVEWRYQQTGIVTTVAHQHPHGGIAVEHFLPAGPFAILPMTGNRSSIVWTEHVDLAPRLLALPEAAFAAELRARFGDFLGAVAPLGPRLG